MVWETALPFERSLKPSFSPLNILTAPDSCKLDFKKKSAEEKNFCKIKEEQLDYTAQPGNGFHFTTVGRQSRELEIGQTLSTNTGVA